MIIETKETPKINMMVENEVDLETKLAVIDKAAKYLEKLNTKITKLQKERDALNVGVETLWKILDICPRCRGEKEYFQRSCAEDEGEVRLCRRCNGSGKYEQSLG